MAVPALPVSEPHLTTRCVLVEKPYKKLLSLVERHFPPVPILAKKNANVVIQIPFTIVILASVHLVVSSQKKYVAVDIEKYKTFLVTETTSHVAAHATSLSNAAFTGAKKYVMRDLAFPALLQPLQVAGKCARFRENVVTDVLLPVILERLVLIYRALIKIPFIANVEGYHQRFLAPVERRKLLNAMKFVDKRRETRI